MKWNDFKKKPKSFKLFVSGNEFGQKRINTFNIWIKTFKIPRLFRTVPFQNISYCYLALSASENDIRSSLSSLMTNFSNLNIDAS